ncbi:TRAP transporter TatT component family protein [Desulfobacula sp.]|uniref:TRAP transporter TatT component family protein n=1 Tax=Desulfobacula sp. TaxID=2593537 RepID=UPI0025C4BDE7|nr:TRAP transporter TatT component family protein [Desulfobacula sp.]
MILHRMLNHNFKQSISSVAVFVFCITSLFFSSGCSVIMSSATSDMMEHLSSTILNNDDLTLVKTGAPAYLLMIDSLISKDPENDTLLSTASMLYTAYADLFVKDVDRSRKMAAKALNYANRAICLEKNNACMLKSKTFEEFEKIISNMKKKHVPALFALGNAWAGWIMANKNDFNAIADMSHIELIMQRVIELDETYRDGAAYLYLGTLATLLPPALGGKPELGKQYFEKAVKLSRGKNLMVKVLYAKLYAKMIFDRKLHDQLLKDVIAADPYVSGYTLINIQAQIQARELIDGADDYF